MKDLKDLNVSTILSCLSLVEEYIPRRESMPEYLPSNDFNPNDVISLQEEAKKMMNFIGLVDYMPIVTVEKMSEGQAGSINLNKDKEVFINIGKDLFSRNNVSNAVLAVLAHEICHKLLFVHGLYMSDTMINEICTDLATLYVGFGELTLKGCKEVKSWKTERYNGDGTKTITTHTQIFTTGYLTPASYEYAYILVAHSYGIRSTTKYGFVDNYDLDKLTKFNHYNTEQVKTHFIKDSYKLTENLKVIIQLQQILEQLKAEMTPVYKQLDNRYKRILIGNGGLKQHPIATQYAMTCPPQKMEDIPSPSELRAVRDNLSCLLHTLRIYGDLNKVIECPFCGRKSEVKIFTPETTIRKCKCGHIFCWDPRIENTDIPLWSSRKKEKRVMFSYIIKMIKRLFGK